MKILRSVLFVFAALLLTTAAKAQQTNVKADIPFNFFAGGHQYPAGEYWLKSMPTTDAIIHIGGVDDNGTQILLSNACSDTTYAKESKLVFRHVGDNYFLYQVWTAGYGQGREFSRGRAETMLARNHENTEVVIVAANITK